MILRERTTLSIALALVGLVGCGDASDRDTGAGGAPENGALLEACGPGFARVGDEPCAATCEVQAGCSARQHCEDSSLPARCVCDIGYAGAGCAACAAGFVADASGACTASFDGQVLVAGALGSSTVLFGIDRVSGMARAIRTLGDDALTAPIDALALDPMSRALYAARAGATGEEVGRLDPATGSFAPLVPPGAVGPTLFFDATKGRLGSIDPSGRLVAIDPSTGSVTPGPAVASAELQSIAYSKLAGDALAVTKEGALVRVDLTTGVVTHAAVAGMSVRPYRGVAVDPVTGHVFLSRDRDDGLRQVARRVAIDLGHAEQATAEPTILYTSFSPVVRGPSSGPALYFVSHLASGSEGRTRITIDVANPEVGVVIWNRSPAEIVLTKGARPAFVAVYSDLPSGALADTFVVEGGAARPDKPFVHVAPTAAPLDASWTSAVDFVRVYGERAWAERRLPPSPTALTFERIDGAVDELDANLSFVRSRAFDAPLFGPVAIATTLP